MGNYVWLSSAMQDSTLIQRVKTDISTNNADGSLEAIELNQKGLPAPSEFCPQKIWGDGAAPTFKKMPDLFCARGHWIVSENAAEIIRQFDLGCGALYPVIEGIFQSDSTSRVPGNYFCWIFGNTKSAFLSEYSKNVGAPAVPGLWRDMPWKLQDGDIAVSQAALAGPDVWLDKMLFKSVFLSGPLGDTLERANLGKGFRLFKCRMA